MMAVFADVAVMFLHELESSEDFYAMMFLPNKHSSKCTPCIIDFFLKHCMPLQAAKQATQSIFAGSPKRGLHCQQSEFWPVSRQALDWVIYAKCTQTGSQLTDLLSACATLS